MREGPMLNDVFLLTEWLGLIGRRQPAARARCGEPTPAMSLTRVGIGWGGTYTLAVYTIIFWNVVHLIAIF